MAISNQAGTSRIVDTERTRNLQVLERLTARYKQLNLCTSAKDQRERASLDATAMKLYTALYPRSIHSWDQSYEVVLRSRRRAS